MLESEYWDHLRFRMNSLARDPALNGWCDWFTPKRYILRGPLPRIIGRVGFVNGRNAVEVEFTLYLSQTVIATTEIDWSKLLPERTASNWFSWDQHHKRLEFGPF